MKYKVYAIQGVEFSEIEIEANSKERAQEIYEAKWNDGDEIYSVDYLGDDVRYVIAEVLPEAVKQEEE